MSHYKRSEDQMPVKVIVTVQKLFQNDGFSTVE